MSLAAATRLGPYEILMPIGSGGMGDVYRARDTRLDRDVAVKVLPAHLANDPAARSRFEREAKAIAALSHPNILAIHDMGTDAGIAYAVTELLSGETLRARLNGAPLPARKTIDIASQIARGLAAAHDKGLVHRDLKPENLFISADGQVKILDFGLARPMSRPGETADVATELQQTDPGTVLGTVGYMSPEQVKGQPADHRADIFSFGCVLYEMLTGRRAFQRETAAETMTAVLREDPPDLAPDAIAGPMAAIVRHCLEKQPEERFQSVRDLGFALQSAGGSSASGAVPPIARAVSLPRGLLWAAVTVAIAAATGLVVWRMAQTPPPPEAAAIRAVLPLPGVALPTIVGKDDRTIAVSSNGRLLAYVAPMHSAIMLRNLETGETRVLVEGGEVGEPFFSPDDQFVGFVQGSGGTIRSAVWGDIKKIAVTGGAATVVATGIIGTKGAAWGDDGWIYYAPAPSAGLWRAPAAGNGTPEKLTDPDVAHGEKSHRRPFVLPGSRALLFVVGTTRITSFDEARIEALDLSNRTRHHLVDGGTAPQYLPTGHLLYERAGQLIAMRFDPERLTTRGAPVTVADGVQDLTLAGVSYHSVSANGTLFFVPRLAMPSGAIVALDRQGRATRLADAPFAISSGALSPDGRRLAIDPDGATQQIAMIDLARNALQRVTYEWDNASPIWTPDGSRLIFRSNTGGGTRRLFWQPADGSGVAEALTTSARDEIPTSIHDKMIVYEDLDPVTRNDLWILSLDDRVPHVLVRTPFDETGARFSPDGRWIAYQSNQSGAWEVYIQTYPSSGGRQQASQGGGVRALWQPDGRSLTYLKGQDLMSVAISPAGAGTPVKLFAVETSDLLVDVMRDGRFIVLRRQVAPAANSLNLIVNWFDEVRRRLRE